MNLDDYFSTPGAMSVKELRIAIGAEQDAQIRQWRHGYANRVPSPVNCVQIERATNGAVKRWDLRPDDWREIWPELVGAKGAPKPKRKKAEAKQRVAQ